MDTDLIPLLVVTVLALALDLFVIRLLWFRRTQAGAGYLARMIVAVMVWTAAEMLQLVFLDIPSNITYSKIAYLGIVSTVPFFVLFVLEYTGRERWINRRTQAALWAIPLITLALVLTNERHGLIWPAVIPNPDPTNPVPVYLHGAGYFIFIAYSYLLLLAASLWLLWMAFHLPTLQRMQLVAIVLAVPLPVVANVLYILRISPVHDWDLAPIAFGLTGQLLTLAIYRFQLQDLLPLARDKVYESLPDGLVVLDLQDRIVDVNPAGIRLATLAPKFLIGRHFGRAFPYLLPAFESKGVSEVPVPGPQSAWLEMRVSELYNGRGGRIGRLVVLHEITERRQVEQELQEKSRELARLAVTDELTGLNNRRYAEDALQAEFQRAERYHQPLALAIFDLDLFKLVNDQLGHAMGDEVLRGVARCLRESMRTTDIVARFGGDEFLVLLPNTTLQDAWLAMERMRFRLSERNFAPVGEPVSISGGVTAWFPGDKPDEALRRADRLLYRAKGAGRGAIFKDGDPL